ncbi:DNA-binding transcriptional regulator, ArsR family [Pedococcus dokdonensis]|uniref:DNA-binding transcriptional regulator, ArsR family n=1 Tax=Pedococcus dokdonensis TaxID=443156 RepID=A0A1H0QJG0_9MICO|nr:metalloregulator ArsR/SmtB family transcription factor [Pedococcus dokdonensis]SDP16846.1 DNA-binding transcriptional regulator, ArsR family [Pedococcus dokdonensis]
MEHDQLSTTFAALADPTRRAILERLAGGDATVGELAEPFAMSLPAISKHLSVLERAGLVAKDRDGQRRNCRITATPLKSATSWLEEYRRHWEANLDNLDAYLNTLQQQRLQQPRTPQPRTQGTARPTTIPGLDPGTHEEKQS